MRRNLHKKLPESRAAWFVVLERARTIEDEAVEREARRRLKQLGVSVRYRGRRPGAKRRQSPRVAPESRAEECS
jgi:hypothetical protein